MKYSLILLIGIFVIVLGTSDIYAMEKGVFQPPNLEGYKFDTEWMTDIDGDGNKITHLTRYLNSAGDKIARLETKNRIWGWIIKNHKYPENKNDLTKNYVIRDNNCDGIFDELYGSDEHFYLPDCLKDKGKK